MKYTYLLFCYLLFASAGFSQPKPPVGAWIWRDATTSVSLFFKSDGKLELYRSPLSEPLADKYLRKGEYIMDKADVVTIKWSDGTVETCKLVYLDKYKFRISLTLGKEKKKDYTFNKVVDEEVVEQ